MNHERAPSAVLCGFMLCLQERDCLDLASEEGKLIGDEAGIYLRRWHNDEGRQQHSA